MASRTPKTPEDIEPFLRQHLGVLNDDGDSVARICIKLGNTSSSKEQPEDGRVDVDDNNEPEEVIRTVTDLVAGYQLDGEYRWAWVYLYSTKAQRTFTSPLRVLLDASEQPGGPKPGDDPRVPSGSSLSAMQRSMAAVVTASAGMVQDQRAWINELLDKYVSAVAMTQDFGFQAMESEVERQVAERGGDSAVRIKAIEEFGPALQQLMMMAAAGAFGNGAKVDEPAPEKNEDGTPTTAAQKFDHHLAQIRAHVVGMTMLFAQDDDGTLKADEARMSQLAGMIDQLYQWRTANLGGGA